MKALVLCLTTLAPACATVGDLREVSDSVGRLADVVAESEAMSTQARAEAAEVKKDVNAVAARAEERTGSFLGALLSPNGAIAGVLSLGSTIGLHFYRNRTRKRALKGQA